MLKSDYNTIPGQVFPVPVLFYAIHHRIKRKGRGTMRSAIRQTGKAHSVTTGLVVAASVSMMITLLLSAAIAFFLNTEKVTWQQAGYWIMGMLFASSFIGGKCAYASVKRQRFIISLMSGILYWGLLLCICALFFGGNLGAVWETAGIIGAGSGSAALLHIPITKRRTAKLRRAYR